MRRALVLPLVCTLTTSASHVSALDYVECREPVALAAPAPVEAGQIAVRLAGLPSDGTFVLRDASSMEIATTVQRDEGTTVRWLLAAEPIPPGSYSLDWEISCTPAGAEGSLPLDFIEAAAPAGVLGAPVTELDPECSVFADPNYRIAFPIPDPLLPHRALLWGELVVDSTHEAIGFLGGEATQLAFRFPACGLVLEDGRHAFTLRYGLVDGETFPERTFELDIECPECEPETPIPEGPEDQVPTERTKRSAPPRSCAMADPMRAATWPFLALLTLGAIALALRRRIGARRLDVRRYRL